METESLRMLAEYEHLHRIPTEEAWETPVTLEDFLLPVFKSDLLPAPLSSFAEELARFSETPIELAAMIALGTISATTARAFEIEVKPGYREPINIWVCVALDSGNRKSSVVSECTAPISAWEARRSDELQAEVKESYSKRKSEESFIASLRGKLGKLDDEQERLAMFKRIAELESQLTEVVRVPQLWAADINSESAGMIMYENNERMAVLTDEAGFFDTLAGRYSGGVPNLDLFLKAHAGTPERVNRVGRPPVQMKRPSLTIVVSPQRSVLHSLASVPGFRGKGFLARFLYLLPRSPLGYRRLSVPSMSASILGEYSFLIDSLLNRVFDEGSTKLAPAQLLKLSGPAYDQWLAFALELEPKLREEGDLYALKDWASKLPGATARIAALFHLIESTFQVEELSLLVTESSMLRAISLSKVLIEHAKASFGIMGQDPEIESARAVLRWIERTKCPRFTERDCHHALQSRFKRVKDLRPALQVLVEHHFIREAHRSPVPHRPSRAFFVNPNLFDSTGSQDHRL